MRAARRVRATGQRATVRAERGYPAPAEEEDLGAVLAQLAATRALLTASTPQEVATIVATLIRDLGGAVIPARLADPERTLQLDVSLGLSEPLLPWAEPVSVAAMRLVKVLPGFFQDARQVFDRVQVEARRADEAERDALTGLLARRAWMRRLSAAGPADAVCLIDLDHFKAANDSGGHAAGDEVLRSIGGLLLQVLRPGDACGRYGGDELACLAPGMPAEALAARIDQLRARWQQQRPVVGAGVGLSAGVAQMGDREPRGALNAADRALYRVKARGRDATALATDEDYAERHP